MANGVDGLPILKGLRGDLFLAALRLATAFRTTFSAPPARTAVPIKLGLLGGPAGGIVLGEGEYVARRPDGPGIEDTVRRLFGELDPRGTGYLDDEAIAKQFIPQLCTAVGHPLHF